MFWNILIGSDWVFGPDKQMMDNNSIQPTLFIPNEAVQFEIHSSHKHTTSNMLTVLVTSPWPVLDGCNRENMSDHQAPGCHVFFVFFLVWRWNNVNKPCAITFSCLSVLDGDVVVLWNAVNSSLLFRLRKIRWCFSSSNFTAVTRWGVFGEEPVALNPPTPHPTPFGGA